MRREMFSEKQKKRELENGRKMGREERLNLYIQKKTEDKKK